MSVFKFPKILATNPQIEFISNVNFNGYSLSVLREDTIHPKVSGNKYRKLKYNLIEARKLEQDTLLTFGGAYSNHIAAVASAGKMHGFKTVGIIRGEELSEKINENPTLTFAKSCGMELHFISRTTYKMKDSLEFKATLKSDFGDFYLLPEGGTNQLAVKGCEEILSEATKRYDYICVPVGTGGTMAGIVEGAQPHQSVIGYSALKGTFQKELVQKFSEKQNYSITDSYCFGGYAKIDSSLVRFINEFNDQTGMILDPVYTGKMMYGIVAMMKNKYFEKNSHILAIHTGGLQGIEGMNQYLKKKNAPQINL
ncbi:1-aminocyclopropane-1-carboxylate deaminase/D-cysteine desulfhydrase [Jejudonia soesokkakensis]|uniref:1-aminocyclopropane-1-carboxylate deaminase/D-cysteine desulfhydrase n=1 Tax=Jejudonia soesokkakensis TaxID=1323432 RepID=A0ABW2MRX3_9FLAO